MEAPGDSGALDFRSLNQNPFAQRVIIVLPFVSFSTNKEALF